LSATYVLTRAKARVHSSKHYYGMSSVSFLSRQYIYDLLSLVEIQAGKIEIDGVNTRNIGLDTLRGRLALVPQDNILFLGTLRENL